MIVLLKIIQSTSALTSSDCANSNGTNNVFKGKLRCGVLVTDNPIAQQPKRVVKNADSDGALPTVKGQVIAPSALMKILRSVLLPSSVSKIARCSTKAPPSLCTLRLLVFEVLILCEPQLKNGERLKTLMVATLILTLMF